MSKRTALRTGGTGGPGRKVDLRRNAGAIPALARNPRKPTRARSLLKATLAVLAGVSLALALTLALTGPGLANGGLARQASHGGLSARDRSNRATATARRRPSGSIILQYDPAFPTYDGLRRGSSRMMLEQPQTGPKLSLPCYRFRRPAISGPDGPVPDPPLPP